MVVRQSIANRPETLRHLIAQILPFSKLERIIQNITVFVKKKNSKFFKKNVEKCLTNLIFFVRIKSLNSVHVAQVVEHILGKDEVTGSNPVVGYRKRKMEVNNGEGEV